MGRMVEVDTKLFRTVLTVAAERSFSVAARRMGYSQATMSLRIQALEEKLGVQLLARGPRDVRLTPAGRSLLPEIQALVDLHDRMVGRLRSMPVVATVRLGVAEGCAAALLPGLMNDMLADRSGAQLDILCRTSSSLQRMIEAQRLDLAVLPLPGNATIGLDMRRLRLHWVASPGFAFDPGAPVPVAWHEADCLCRVAGVAALEGAGIAYLEVSPGPDERDARTAVAEGTAVTVMVEGAVPAALEIMPAQSGLPLLNKASVRLLESPGAQSEATEAVKRKILNAYRRADAQPA